jgi:hypothetical protein
MSITMSRRKLNKSSTSTLLSPAGAARASAPTMMILMMALFMRLESYHIYTIYAFRVLARCNQGRRKERMGPY